MSQSSAGQDLAQSIVDQVQTDLGDIKSQYAALTSQPTSAAADTKAPLEQLAQRTRDVQAYFQASSPSLTSHDQKVLSEAISSLAQSIATTRSTTQPRTKFSFKKKPAAAPSQTAPPAASTTTPAASFTTDPSTSTTPEPLFRPSTIPTIRRPLFPTPSIVLRHQTAEHISPNLTSPSPPTAILSHLISCIIALPSSPPLATAHVRHTTFTLLLLGRVSGAVHLTSLTDCVVLVSARQFRLHDSRNVRVYLACGSEPVIEDCEGVGFGRLPAGLGWEEDGENRWDQVRDFSWLAEAENPHWRTVGQEERVEDGVWREIVEGDGCGKGRKEMLRLAGVGT
ncbi:TBCC-domain-containing protein [Myriangium duriaei CBS 260.36]|uniref:TBCC-domain-containing protein n=1 Tax=Myriangium duriaei CBS 260.36 TaxID=1168546 RepID=A0A9P4MQ79_9PEZI|nr:TBCC-domain-containing protein [Myriangium duriaei CBS 260.36]